MNRSDRERQLEARLERERSARRQAEVIAERGMRELWDVNRQLRERIDARTEQIERVFDGAERAVSAWADELEAAAERIRAAAERDGEAGELMDEVRQLARTIDLGRRRIRARPTSASPRVVADELLARWQHRAARRGQLLSVLADRDGVVRGDWVGVVALAEVLIGASVLYGGSGVVEADIRIDGPWFELSILVPPPSNTDDQAADAAERSIDVAVSVAQRLVDETAGSVTATYGDDVWHLVARIRAN